MHSESVFCIQNEVWKKKTSKEKVIENWNAVQSLKNVHKSKFKTFKEELSIFISDVLIHSFVMSERNF